MTDVSPAPAYPDQPAASAPGQPVQVLDQPVGQPGGTPVMVAQYPTATGWVQGPQGWVRAPLQPAHPPKPTVFQRYWPGPGAGAAAPRIAISLIVVAAVVGAIALVPTEPGFGWFLTAVALAAVAVATGLARAGAPATPTDGGKTTPIAVPPAAMAEATAATPAAVNPETITSEVEETAGDEAAGKSEEARVGAPESHEDAPARWRFSFAEHSERVFWEACALALVGVGTFRAAGWLFFWCVVFALGSSAMALAGGRTVRALFAAVWAPVMAPFRSPLWIGRGLRRTDREGARIGITIAVSIVLLAVFGGLFASADAEFRHVLGSILPPLRASDVARAIFCLVVVGVTACGVAFLSAARPKFDEIAPVAAKLVRRIEWVLPLTVLNLLFAVFVFIQLSVLFGGDPNLVGASHAYMRGYAHNGFWQLLVVSLLTLTVLLVTGRIAPRETPTDRTLLRVLLGGLSVFSIVIVAAALKRVAAYEQSYGYTRLRVAVAGIELWFGLLFVLILIAGITLRAAWLPRVVVGSLILSLLAGAIANPDRYVAQRNVDRYQSTGKLSVEYMKQMSADALPAIEQLPPNLRACALRAIARQVESRGDDWRTWNYSRVAARNAVAGYHRPPAKSCPELVHRGD